MPKISVIIPAYNEEAFIEECLRAVLNQKGCSDYEVIVADNGSTDKTKEIAKRMGVNIVSEKKKGVAHARKTGTEAARGEILVHTDADAKPPTDWLAKIESMLDEDPSIVAVSGTFSFYDRNQFTNAVLRVLTPFAMAYDWAITLGRKHVYCGNVGIRASAYKKIGGFNPKLSYGEDIDLSKRLWKVGKIKFTNKLRTATSGRRYQWDKGTAFYFANYLHMSLTGRPWKNELEDVREHSSLSERVRRGAGMSSSE